MSDLFPYHLRVLVPNQRLVKNLPPPPIRYIQILLRMIYGKLPATDTPLDGWIGQEAACPGAINQHRVDSCSWENTVLIKTYGKPLPLLYCGGRRLLNPFRHSPSMIMMMRSVIRPSSV